MPRTSRWTPKKSKEFSADDVLAAIRVRPRNKRELREALGTVHPSYDNYWLTLYCSQLVRQGLITFIGVTHAGRYHACATRPIHATDEALWNATLERLHAEGHDVNEVLARATENVAAHHAAATTPPSVEKVLW